MSQEFHELDVVALTSDLPQLGLVRGQVGTIVMQHSPTDFEVEFVDESGKTYQVCTLSASQLIVLHYSPIDAA